MPAPLYQYTDEWQSCRGSRLGRTTVRHGVREWARDADADGQGEVHCHSGEGTVAALRTHLRSFLEVHKPYRHLYVATYVAMVDAKRITSDLIRRMCLGDQSGILATR